MDIMGALLRGEEPQVTREENDIIERLAFYMRRLEHRNASTVPEERHRAWTRPKETRPKKKVTYYLTKLIIQHLKKAQQRLIEALDGESERRISKSVLVETALRTALQELDAKGPRVACFKCFMKSASKPRSPTGLPRRHREKKSHDYCMSQLQPTAQGG